MFKLSSNTQQIILQEVQKIQALGLDGPGLSLGPLIISYVTLDKTLTLVA